MVDSKILVGDCREHLREMEAESVDCVVTSPPYLGLRKYKAGDREIGQEPTIDEYIEALVEVFDEVHRVLKPTGNVFLNIGDGHVGGGRGSHCELRQKQSTSKGSLGLSPEKAGQRSGLAPRQLMLVPERLAIAMQRNNKWFVRQRICWQKCLSGGTHVYIRSSKKGNMVMNLKDLYRLDPSTIELWNGERWTHLVNISKTRRNGDELEIVLRSGERISCTKDHRFPTIYGLKYADDLKVGDILKSTQLPDIEGEQPSHIDNDLAWFLGMYLAEGSMSGHTIQISGHQDENERWERLGDLVESYGGTYSLYQYEKCGKGKNMAIRCRMLHAAIKTYLVGKTAKNKGLSNYCWNMNNSWLESLLIGYLEGDGGYEEKNNRWRLGFTRNDCLEKDMRTLCSRVNATLTLNMSSAKAFNKVWPTYQGEIRLPGSINKINKFRQEIVEIRKSRARFFYDLEVEDEPHLFALASGILTHNSNPMPESVKNRDKSCFEYIWHMTKQGGDYFWDQDWGRTPLKDSSIARAQQALKRLESGEDLDLDTKWTHVDGQATQTIGKSKRHKEMQVAKMLGGNKTKPFHDKARQDPKKEDYNKKQTKQQLYGEDDSGFPAHRNPDTFNEYWNSKVKDKWSMEKGLVGAIRRNIWKFDDDDVECIRQLLMSYLAEFEWEDRGNIWEFATSMYGGDHFATFPVELPMRCIGSGCPSEGMVLDPFGGSGTTAVAALSLNRNAIIIELNEKYAEIARSRIGNTTPGLF